MHTTQDDDISGWGALFRMLGVAPFLHVLPTPPHASPEANVALSLSRTDTDADLPRLKCIARYLSAAWDGDYSRYAHSDSDFGRLLRTNPWMVGTDDQAHVPSDLWWSGIKESLLGDNMVKVTSNVSEPMARALGVQFEVTVEAVVDAMKKWSEDGMELTVAHMHRYVSGVCI